MWRNYIKTAFRNLLRYKGFSIINILGLSIGMASSILIFLWIQFELSYDKYNDNSENMYRLVQTQYYATGPLTTTCMPGPIADDIRSDIPEVENSFMYYWVSMFCTYEEKTLKESVCMADPQIWEMLDFNFIHGDPLHVFDDINSIVITEETAMKYFGEEDPMGKVLTLNQKHHFKVTGVIEKPPANSSFQIKGCIPFKYIEELGYTIDRYGWNTYYVYVQLHKEANYADVNAKVKNYIIEKKDDPDDESKIDLFLFPFEKIHLHSVRGEAGDIQYIYIFSAVAIFILLIACINFMNLTTARSTRRSREIGIRKTVGAQRSQIMQQFYGETMIMTVIAFVISILLTYLIVPSFNNFAETELSLNLFNPWNITALLLILIFVGFFAGSYPALYLSAFRPLGVLRETMNKGRGGKVFRRALVIFQFSLSIILIICTMIIFNQMDYIRSKDIGINKDHVMYQYMSGGSKEKYEVIKAELLQNPNILSVSRGNTLPFWIGSNSGGFDWEGSEGNNDILIGFTWVDYNYEKVMGLNMASGRFYDEQFVTDTTRIVINEKLAGFITDEEAVGKWLSWGGDHIEIIGVVEDFHHLPMHHEIDPLVIILDPDRGGYLFARYNPQNKEAAETHFKQVWEKISPNYPYNPQMLDHRYQRTYVNEQKLGEIFRIFTILAIFISCLGLFGMAAYIAEQRTREISIRKVYGAETPGLVYIMTSDFIRWIVLANVIAWPIAWFAMQRWLENYIYHTKISVWFFALAALASILIAVITVSLHAFRTARRNPATVLATE